MNAKMFGLEVVLKLIGGFLVGITLASWIMTPLAPGTFFTSELVPQVVVFAIGITALLVRIRE